MYESPQKEYGYLAYFSLLQGKYHHNATPDYNTEDHWYIFNTAVGRGYESRNGRGTTADAWTALCHTLIRILWIVTLRTVIYTTFSWSRNHGDRIRDSLWCRCDINAHCSASAFARSWFTSPQGVRGVGAHNAVLYHDGPCKRQVVRAWILRACATRANNNLTFRHEITRRMFNRWYNR